MFRSVVGSVLIGLGFIGLAMGRGRGKLYQEFPGIWIGCIVCLAIGFIIMGTKPKENIQGKAKRKKKKKALELKEHAEFVRRAEKIKINPQECEVLSGYDKIVDDGEIPTPVFTGGAKMGLAFLPEEAPKPDVHVESCIIAFKTNYKGKQRRFVSQRIYKNRQTCEFLIANEKAIDLYIDRNAPGKHWFDLSFLEK